MKTFITILISSSLGIIVGIPALKSIPVKYQKKIVKEVSKTLDTEIHAVEFVEREHDLSKGYYQSTCFDVEDRASGEIKGQVYFRSVKTCTLGGCQNPEEIKSPNAGYEFFDLAIILDTQGHIKKLKILSYLSDYGYEITSKRFLKKFYGKSPCELAETNQIDAISGATISSNALINEVHLLCK